MKVFAAQLKSRNHSLLQRRCRAKDGILVWDTNVSIEMLLIVPTFIPFIRNLSQGKSLNGASALLELDTSEVEAAFVALMAKL